MATGNRRIPAASARAHTRKGKSDKGSPFGKGILKKLFLVSFVGFLAWAYTAIQPPPPNVCGSPNGPPVTAPRVKLHDGRHLAYKESGVPRERAKYKIVLTHGFSGSRNDTFDASKELVEELGVYIVSFDRPGYGESDPDPKRSVKSAALDIEELADQLGLGPKFYVMGASIGGHAIWGCLKYIPHRLAGAALLAPVVNYRWPGFPANLSNEAYYQQLRQDQWALRVPYYTPWLTYWWMTQKWFPSSSVIQGNWKPLNRQDAEIFKKLTTSGRRAERMKSTVQQGVFESLHRDMIVMFGKWEFDPMDFENPFPNNEASVHIWQGDEDALVPVLLQRYIAKRLPWIHYHELPEAGHVFNLVEGMPDRILKRLLLGE
uniref:TSA: Wollemia nobilis Ref_Wollemi_Transcript_3398_1754 transcribed RNA sequence n=1 Tax=Wollemia nobilis TaxID=56998 RepID=A0A0C9QWR4_9CONI